MTDPTPDFEALAKAQALLVHFPLQEAHVAATARNLQLIHDLARLVMDHPLPADNEPAPVFSHDPR